MPNLEPLKDLVEGDKFRFILKELAGDQTGLLGGILHLQNGQLYIDLDGHGTLEGDDLIDAVMVLELWRDRPRLVAWPNINECCPAIVDLSYAHHRYQLPDAENLNEGDEEEV